jgi:hypothetical protein
MKYLKDDIFYEDMDEEDMDEEEGFDENTRASRRENRKKNGRKMKVDGAGNRDSARISKERFQRNRRKNTRVYHDVAE